VSGWYYYNHAVLPNAAPHEEADIKSLNSGEAWKQGKKFPLFARWTSEWDCGYETNWWYVIKDTVFDFQDVKSPVRTKIRKGLKNFFCHQIDPAEYAEEIFQVLYEANFSYPKSTRLKLNKSKTKRMIQSWGGENINVWGAFNEEGKLCAYSLIEDCGTWFKIISQKAIPSYEKLQVNAAVLYRMISDLSDGLRSGKYICNGERTISHETNFNNYLEKYFAFRKAYCKIHIQYRKPIKRIVQMCYPFKKQIGKFRKSKLFHMVYSVLEMESLNRLEKIQIGDSFEL